MLLLPLPDGSVILPTDARVVSAEIGMNVFLVRHLVWHDDCLEERLEVARCWPVRRDSRWFAWY